MLGPPDHPDEAELVALLRFKDEGAFLALVQRYHSSMLRAAQAFVGNLAVAEEVAQEAWLAALEGIGRFEGRSSVRSWLLAIVANSARTRARHEGRSTPLSALEPDQDEGAAVDASRFLSSDHPRWPGHWSSPPEHWPEERLLLKETLLVTERAIAALPPAQREVIVLRDVEGWTAKEVCDALSVSEANQRVLLHRARAKVRTRLEEHFRRPE